MILWWDRASTWIRFAGANTSNRKRSLLSAILEEAVQDYRKYSRGRDLKSKSRFHEVDEWFKRRDKKWIFSFESVCQLLDLDPEYIRRRLREAQGHDGKRAA